MCLTDFKAVLFDVDGTLVNTLDAITQGLGDTFERYRGIRPSDEDLKKLIGLPLTKQVKLYFDEEPSPEQTQEMIDFAIGRFHAGRELETIYPAAVEALQFCFERGLKTALVTSKSARELAGFLPGFAGRDAVHATVCASDVRSPKPDPESALLACEHLGVKPSEAVMIGDSIYDLRCAKAAGLRCVAVNYGSGSPQDLLAENPDLVFETPEELLDWAKTSFLEPTCPERK